MQFPPLNLNITTAIYSKMLSSSKKDFRKDTKGYWSDFATTQTPQTIAKQLLQDAATLDAGGMPSQLAMHMPSPSSNAALAIASYLTPSPDLPSELKRYLFEKIRTRLRQAIEKGELVQEPPLPEDGYLIAGDFSTTVPVPQESRKPSAKVTEPTKEEVETAVRVLQYLSLDVRTAPGEVQRVIKALESRFGLQSPDSSSEQPQEKEADVSLCWNDEVRKYHAQRPPTRLRACYICRFLLVDPHPRYGSMCRPCGAFNYSGSALSLPQSLKLAGRTALVTGARVHLGYGTSLRLLRCGATVIATTRYPNDAAVRYSQEPDSAEWMDRLKVIGADFRTAKDAFALVAATKVALGEMGATKLDILINNAAQTLTDSIKKEERAVSREKQHSKEAVRTNLVFRAVGDMAYHPRVRGGAAPLGLSFYSGGGEESDPGAIATTTGEGESVAVADNITLPENVKDDGRTEIQPYFKSSWVQTVSEIPYEDIVSAHAVNAFVPLILFRELLPLMGAALKAGDPPSESKDEPRHPCRGQKPLGYVINVSSREGILERTPDHSAKAGTHVHTNMTKAAVNMITQTEAASMWRTRGVAMNTVDPGFMSAAPEMDRMYGGIRPLDWEDGAGRVLWPIAIGEVEGDAVWGRFLKHYGAVDVDSDLKRG